MSYDKQLISKKLQRWDKYLHTYHLPEWEDIPNFGLYMEQVIEILKQYLDYLPVELKEDQFITAPTINNYVRKKVMPEPRKKMYYREHIAYLIIILTLKQSLSLAMIQKIIPTGLSEAEIEKKYKEYIVRHKTASEYFLNQIRELAAVLVSGEEGKAESVKSPEELIMTSAITCSFSRLLAEKLILLDDKNVDDYKDE